MRRVCSPGVVDRGTFPVGALGRVKVREVKPPDRSTAASVMS